MALEPTDAEVIRSAIDNRLLALHTSMPGVVTSYNPDTQCAEVQPVVKSATPILDGDVEHEDLPIIHNVPIEWPGGGGFAMQFPVQKGDHVWLIFSEAATAQWRSTGQISEPGDLRRHDLSYAMALWVRGPASEALDPLSPATEARMICPHPFVFGVQAMAHLVALSNKVDAAIETIRTGFNAHTVPTAMGPSGTPVPIAPIATTAGTSLKSD